MNIVAEVLSTCPVCFRFSDVLGRVIETLEDREEHDEVVFKEATKDLNLDNYDVEKTDYGEIQLDLGDGKYKYVYQTKFKVREKVTV